MAVRLNLIPGTTKDDNIKFFLQTIHAGRTPKGKPLGYDSAATVRNASFYVSVSGRRSIASGEQHKFPMAAIVGELAQIPPNFGGVEIRFNPMTGHLFVEGETGFAVQSADEVTVFNNRCYARGNIIYWAKQNAPEPLGDLPTDAKFNW